MGYNLGNEQRQVMHAYKGVPPLGVDFEQYANGEIAMWTHIDHALPFEEVTAFFMRIREHLDSFTQNAAMCPYNPVYHILRQHLSHDAEASTRPAPDLTGGER